MKITWMEFSTKLFTKLNLTMKNNLKLFCILLGGTLLTAGAVIANYLSIHQTKQISELTLANIEALGVPGGFELPSNDVLEFYFNGQYWKRNPDEKTTNSWWPLVVECQRPDKTTGGQIVCIGGGGNCWNGTSCI